MPTKTAKKKPSTKVEKEAEVEKPPVRQVVEVVEEEESVPEAIETIKKDTQEIEHAIEEIEEHIEGDHKEAPDLHAPDLPAGEAGTEMVDHRTVVQSLFAKEREDAVAPAITVEQPKERSMGVWVGLMLGIVAAVGISLLVFVKGPQQVTSLIIRPSPTPTQAPNPTPTTPTLNRKDVKVRVVNGGGIAGAGGKMKSFLEGLGYTVASVGNAAQYGQATTEIQVKSGKDDVASLLKDDLKTEYSLGSGSADLAEDEEFDALVTVGTEE